MTNILLVEDDKNQRILFIFCSRLEQRVIFANFQRKGGML